MRTSTFFPFGAPPIANLEKRVAMQRAALAQAEADLAEARGERAAAELEELDEVPSVYISNEHRRMRAADERRRRGLGPIEETGAPSAVAEFIARADDKRRGVNQPDFVPGPPQTPPPKASAEFILAAYRKANQGLGKK
jgi:hypothetical protein